MKFISFWRDYRDINERSLYVHYKYTFIYISVVTIVVTRYIDTVHRRWTQLYVSD